jgi:tetratricopeptide (TPR) repeat protein
LLPHHHHRIANHHPQEIETWVAALASYDNNEFDEALKNFDAISDTSKILFNCGVIHATLGEHEKAVDCYQRAVRLDQYLAVAYFQQGVSNFLMGDFEEALANFNDTLLYLRGNNNIDYEQLGLKFKLYSCEVLFNRGLCYIYLQQRDAGLQDLSFAAKEKVVPDHDVIDEAIREEAEVRPLACSSRRTLTCNRATQSSPSLSVLCTAPTRPK